MTGEKHQEHNQEFSFMKEKIKQQPVYQNKVVRRIASTVGLALLFGVIACFTFVLVHPWMEERFGVDEIAEITIPKDEKPDGTEQAESVTEETATDSQAPVVVTEPAELEISDYRKLYYKLRTVASDTAKSLVTVTAVSSDVDWFNEPYENEGQVSGVIVGNNGVELLVLTTCEEVQSADQLQVTFSDRTSAAATLKNYDRISDLAIISINLGDIGELGEDIQPANLGNSNAIRAGEPVIAIGSPAGTAGSVSYGTVTTSGTVVSAIDGEYEVMMTDITRAAGSNGVLIDYDGYIVGFIQDKYLNSNNKNALTAYSISDMKSIIEHLSNNQDIVYIGVNGADVTKAIAEEQGLVEGVYITGVEIDSPAMNAGLQNGDIIVEVSGKEIAGIADIQEMLLKFSVDQVIQVTVMRQGKDEYKEIECSVTLGTLK